MKEISERSFTEQMGKNERRHPQEPYQLQGNMSQQALGQTHKTSHAFTKKKTKPKTKGKKTTSGKVGKVTLDPRTDFPQLPLNTMRFVLHGTT